MSASLVPPPGWYADPLRRFAHRYWDGANWTDSVGDGGGRQLLDPMSPASATPASQTGQAAPSPAGQAAAAQPAGTGLPTLHERLREAEIAYESLLAEARATRMPEASLARRALEVGIVVHDGAVWLLDVPKETWYRYDGIRLKAAASPVTAGEPTDPAG